MPTKKRIACVELELILPAPEVAVSEKVPFDELATADLVLDRIYAGGSHGHAGDDAIGKLLPVGNQGGFRFKGSVVRRAVQLVVLYTSGAEVDWPDRIDPTTGDFTYYGDNRKPGKDLHDTPRSGNLLLRDIFAASRADADERLKVPPVFLFEKVSGRDVMFRGLLAPGSPRLTSDEELVAVWRTTRDLRFQNYRSHFTVLQTPLVRREWINQVLAGNPLGEACPVEWRSWVRARIYQALEAPRNLVVRDKQQQQPRPADMWMMRAVHAHFADSPVQFEHFAADMWLNSDPHVSSVEVTRPSRDGGRDAIGEFRIGPGEDPVRLQFALEAKCYDPEGGGVGVRLVSRLIARIKHREFGVFVTTAFIASQAYHEVREDQHPIVFITGSDLVLILRRMGLTDQKSLAAYLSTQHPLAPTARRAGDIDVAYPGEHITVDSPPATHSSTDRSSCSDVANGGGQ